MKKLRLFLFIFSLIGTIFANAASYTVNFSWADNFYYCWLNKTGLAYAAGTGYSHARYVFCKSGSASSNPSATTEVPMLQVIFIFSASSAQTVTIYDKEYQKNVSYSFPGNGTYTSHAPSTNLKGNYLIGDNTSTPTYTYCKYNSSTTFWPYYSSYNPDKSGDAQYQVVTIEDGANDLPYVTIYCKDIYVGGYHQDYDSFIIHIGSPKPAAVTTTVTLNKQSGTGGSNSVTATNGQAMPKATMPTRPGYTFNGYFDATTGGTKYYNANGSSARNWDKSSSTANLYAQWSPNTNTAYTVKHYKQQLDGTYSATPDATDNQTGTTATNVTPAVKSYTGFTAPATQTVSILADGSRVVEYQYTRNTYTLTWNLAGGTITTAGTAAGDVLYEAPISAPTVERVGYTFAGWDSDIATTMPAAPLTYTASWSKATTLDLYDNENADDYNAIKTLGNTSLSEIERTYSTVTYHRSAAYTSDNGNARWYTLCLPFDVDQSQLTTAGLLRNVYEFRYATGSADAGDQVTFHFRTATSMIAGRGYLVKATGDMGPDFTFTSVTLNTTADVDNGDVNDLKSTNYYKESGDIAIVGVLRNGTLSAAGKQVMGLANNKIWYPHSSGNPMPAYRAYFYNPNASASVMPRVRIVVEGEGATELEVVDGELYDAHGNNADGDVRAPRKYIRNGVLIIERNGVRYDAQGKRL